MTEEDSDRIYWLSRRSVKGDGAWMWIHDRHNGPGAIYISQPYNGDPATAGNGVMPVLRAQTRKQVDEVFAAGLAAGGTDDGKPGVREEYTDHFYVAYLRDPIGNKVAVFVITNKSVTFNRLPRGRFLPFNRDRHQAQSYKRAGWTDHSVNDISQG